MTELPGVDLEALRQRKAELQAELRAIAQIERAYARLQGRGARGAERVAGRGRGRPSERLGQVVAVLKQADKPLPPGGIHLGIQQQGTPVAWADAGKSMTELARRDGMGQGLLVKHKDGTYGLAEWGPQTSSEA